MNVGQHRFLLFALTSIATTFHLWSCRWGWRYSSEGSICTVSWEASSAVRRPPYQEPDADATLSAVQRVMLCDVFSGDLPATKISIGLFEAQGVARDHALFWGLLIPVGILGLARYLHLGRRAVKGGA